MPGLQPFTLHSFLTVRKDPDTRRRWTQLLNRKGEGTHTNWQPKRFSRVCSLHFPDDHPILENPYPTLLLGYATASSATRNRKPPKERLPTPSHSQTNETQATEQYNETQAREQYAPQDPPVVEDDIETVCIEESHLVDHSYSHTSSGCQNCNNQNKDIKNLKYENKKLQESI